MTFNRGGSFEGGRVRSRRGGAGAVAGGGVGLVAIIGFLIYTFTGVDPTPVLQGAAGGGQPAEQESSVGQCTAEQANTDQRCRLSATVQSLDAYGGGLFADRGAELPLPEVVEFRDSTRSGCGVASAATGPFYCP
ncbi:neutral zinc metallopeptidase, partial [Actinosynnema sp.]|uniref:neutral zinc metallopeptidase n=1 Tax=Actinosynnema sp. TaxID=1872144 RepID=UPI003F82A709